MDRNLYRILQTLEHAREALKDLEAPRVRALLYLDDAYEALKALTYES